MQGRSDGAMGLGGEGMQGMWKMDKSARSATALVCVAFGFYLVTLSRNWSGDAIQFALYVRSGELGNLLQPNHMLYGLLNAGAAGLARVLGWRGGPLLPAQILSALAGALSVGMIYAIGRRLLKSPRLALWVAAGFGLARGVWAYSTDVEVVTTGLATSLFVLWALVSLEDEALTRLRRALLLGLAVGLAVLTYQTSVFLIPVVLAGRLAASTRRKGRPLWALVFLAMTAAVVVPITALVGWAVYRLDSWTELLAWLLQQTRWGIWGQPALMSLARGGYSMLKALSGFPGLDPYARTSFFLARANAGQRAFFAGYYVLLLAGACLPIVLLVQYRAWRLVRATDRAALAAWMIGYGAFGFYWAPSDVQFWAPLLVPWWLIAGLACVGWSRAQSRGDATATPGQVGSAGSRPTDNMTLGHAPSRRPAPGELRRSEVCLWLRAIVLILLAANASSFGLPNRQISANVPYQMAKLVTERTDAHDLVITTGGDRLVLYLPYFCRRPTASLYHLLRRPGTDREAAWTGLESRIQTTQAAGHDVYLVGVEPGHEVWWDVMESVGAGREEILERLSRLFQWKPAWSVAGEQVHVLER